MLPLLKIWFFSPSASLNSSEKCKIVDFKPITRIFLHASSLAGGVFKAGKNPMIPYDASALNGVTRMHFI